jgi:uncharacterized protein (TIGR03067 family)
VNPPDNHGPPGALGTFAGNFFSVGTIEGALLLEGAFDLDASTSLKSITWNDSIGEDEGRRLPASYTLEGGRFEFNSGDEGASRPTEFRTEVGQTIRTVVRR